MVALVSDWGGEKLPWATATVSVGSKWRPELPQGAGHGERRLELHRRAGMVRVLRHRPILWCMWATLCSSGHVGQVEGSSRASGGFGHGGGLLRPWRRSGGGLVHVVKSPWPAINDSVYAAVLQTSWRCYDYVLVRRGGGVREWWCTVRRRHRERGVHARVHHGAPVGRSWRGRGCARGCVCS